LLFAMTAALHAQFFRGVNISGAEFGQAHIPGVFNTDYTYNSFSTFRYFATRNLNLVRFPVMWERLQPQLRGPLDPQNLLLLKSAVAWAAAEGNLLVLDIHNFGRYSINENGKLNTYVLDVPSGGVVKVSRADLADFWVRLSTEFAAEPAVYAYDLMNEPHDLPDWKGISQAVLTAIRNNGDRKLIMVPGDSWSSANRWETTHGPLAWISDPAANFLYEAHQYFDSDESGTYAQTYDAEFRRNAALPTVGSSRVAHFVDWCRVNNVGGYLGEYGVPDSDPRWLAVLEDFLNAIDAAQMPGTFWAAGEWWGGYPLSVQPSNSYTVDRPQMPSLLRHLAPGSFTSLSAASNAGMTFAPDSLMAGYGAGFPTDAAVELTDAAGGVFTAPLLYASSNQINYRIPAEAALGRMTAAVKSGGLTVARGAFTLDRVAPTIFPNGVVLDPRGGRLFLTLYGTGWRNGAMPVLKVGGAELPLLYFGAQPDTPGLDQINAEIPAALTGQLPLTLTVDGKLANPITVTLPQVTGRGHG
jgi:endoglucanase